MPQTTPPQRYVIWADGTRTPVIEERSTDTVITVNAPPEGGDITVSIVRVDEASIDSSAMEYVVTARVAKS